mmetsp:Transcript_6551/g.27238  ORF Transcript_6551/g.27238 Transcript_6551/m.27238 type:complete len:348 (-) Transcript_6551:1158-2201(-)
MLTSWGGVFPPMHPVHAVEDGEHKRKREDELDLSIREGAEGEYASPQNRALAQRRRRFAKSHRDAPEVKVRGVLEYLRARGASVGRQSQRYSALRQSAQARTALVTRQPYCLRERAAPRELLRSFDKCFAAAWLDDDRCVVGTKDNKLAVIRASNLHAPAHQVNLPRRLFQPPERRSSRTTRPSRPLPPPPPPPPPARVFLSSPSEASLARTSSMVGAGSPNLSARALILPSSSAIQAGSCAAAGPFLAFGAGETSASRDLRLRSPRRSPPGSLGPPPRALPSRRPGRSSGKPRPGLPRKSMPFFANRSSIMSLARSTSGTRPTMTTVVPSRSAHTFAAVACSIFFT